MASLGNPTKHTRRTYTNQPQALPKDRKWGEHSQSHSMRLPLPWYLNQTKTLHKKRKWQSNIFDEYRCKISRQNIRKPNPTIDKRLGTTTKLGLSQGHKKVQHTQANQSDTISTKKRQKLHGHPNRWIKSIWYPSMIKKRPTKVGIMGKYLTINKGY